MCKLNKKRLATFFYSVFRFLLIFGLCYLILKPFIVQFLGACMSVEDLNDITVEKIPKHFSTFHWEKAIDMLQIPVAGMVTLTISIFSALIQVFVCALVGYGLARFEFPGKKLATILVIVIMLVPSQVYNIPQYLQFRNFGVFGLKVNLIDSAWPMIILSTVCLGLKQGLYIYLARSFFLGLPNDLENAAYIDGASIPRTFFSVMLPNARTVLITIFLFSFCWHWTDTAFTSVYFSKATTLASMVLQGNTGVSETLSKVMVQRASVLLIIVPLLILFMIFQKFLVQSISRSGLAN